MKSFMQHITEGKATWARVNKLVPERPDDPDINVIGFGVLSLSDLRKEVVRHLNEYAKQVKVGNIDGLVREFTTKYPNMKSKILGLAEVEKELATSQMKRKITLMKKGTK